MTTYEAIVRNKQGSEDSYPLSARTDEGARRKTLRIAREHPDALVFCRFYRSSDGQTGYYNQHSGAGLTGYPYRP